MTTCTVVSIRSGRDWCQAEGHKPYSGASGLEPAHGVYVAGIFVCWYCLAPLQKNCDILKDAAPKDDMKDLLADLESALDKAESLGSDIEDVTGDLRELAENLRDVLA